ncbi:HypC/HybG/HupF family hydrogenase formation chaperone [Patescibacteria group bacterium]|nr:HypC/HybG/HupF family hydrogenase formation chaperone [Patescibacteria group bacterium]MBU1867963.1 HypC/HybG/HupF family hydrogenase formation chaperone [Patescibacteria group bacterium]
MKLISLLSMCLATPLQIKQINKQTATVGDAQHTHEVDLSLIENAQIGDWLICHANLALNKINEQEAQEILQLQQRVSPCCGLHTAQCTEQVRQGS